MAAPTKGSGFLERVGETISETVHGTAEGLKHGAGLVIGKTGEAASVSKESVEEGTASVRHKIHEASQEPNPRNPSYADKFMESMKGREPTYTDKVKEGLTEAKEKLKEAFSPHEKPPTGQTEVTGELAASNPTRVEVKKQI